MKRFKKIGIIFLVIIANMQLIMWFKLFYVIPVIIIFFVIYFIKVKLWWNNRMMSSMYKNNSITTFGYKGKGKDILAQLFIIIRFKKVIEREDKKVLKGKMKKDDIKPKYLSNLDYGYGAKIVHLKELELSPNTYVNFIENDIIKVVKNNDFEGLDFIYSDAGVYLPSHEDTTLNKLYPSFPIFFALSRQLYDMVINLNTQALKRIWIKVREQQDGYVKLLKTLPANKGFLKRVWPKIPYFNRYIFINYRFYREQLSAETGKMPFDKLGLASRDNMLYSTTPSAIKESYDSEFGEIKERWCVIKISDIKYDTRHFHFLLFGYKFEKEKKEDFMKTKRFANRWFRDYIKRDKKSK